MIFPFRLLTWTEAQQHCEAKGMTLFQYDSDDKYYSLKQQLDFLFKAFFETATEFERTVFLGLRRNSQVGYVVH